MEYKLKNFLQPVKVNKLANIHYFEFTEEFHTKKDCHSFRELLYVDSGYLEIDADNYKGSLKENQLIIHQSNEAHSLLCPHNENPNVIIIGFECDCNELDSFSESPVTLNDSQKKLLSEAIKEGRNVFLPPYDIPGQKNMKKRKDFPFGADQLIKLKLENLFIELIRNKYQTDIVEQSDTASDKTIEIARYLNENFRQKIKLSELCFLFGTNSTTLCNTFYNTYGKTIISYVITLRIKEAKRLMRSGNYNLTEISSMVGFSSIHYFSKIFKQYENQSPTAYIKTVKAKFENL